MSLTESLCASHVEQSDIVGTLSRRGSVALCSAWQSRGTAPALPLVFHRQKHQICYGFAMRRGWLLPSVAYNLVPSCGLLSPWECFPWQCPAQLCRMQPMRCLPAGELREGAAAGEEKLRFSIWLVRTVKSGPGCSSQARELTALPAPPGLSK